MTLHPLGIYLAPSLALGLCYLASPRQHLRAQALARRPAHAAAAALGLLALLLAWARWGGLLAGLVLLSWSMLWAALWPLLGAAWPRPMAEGSR